MLARVQVDHELAERPFQPRQRAAQHDEARAGHLRRGGEIHHAERLAQLEMLLRLEAEIARLAMLLQHDVGGFVRAVRHVRIEHVRQDFEDAA